MLRQILPRYASLASPLSGTRLLAPVVPLATAHHHLRALSTTTPALDESTPSATQAITFKRRLPHRRYAPLSSFYVPLPTPSAEEAVSTILYNTPPPNIEPESRHVLNCLVQNEPGVLSRVSGILAARGFNIDSLVVAKTEVHDLSRMTIIFRGKSAHIEQARRQLEDLVPVWAVLDYTNTKLVEREVLLVKVSILGPEHLHEQLATRDLPDMGVAFEDEILQRVDEGDKSISPSAALRHTFSHLHSLTELARLFDGRIVDVSSDCVVIELCAKPNRVDSFVKLLKPFGILEAARSGVMAMPRSPVLDHYEPQHHSAERSAQDGLVDATMLPPG
ncbi:small subunit of acetolactate synthase-domain-containing protein [Endogone sp. FLAS-F59071]|nr:small subunit of acetolactate synthase-domain-containing protein [Endogone sp. FLAS-F59071]|eukprot:RUS13779.1 small subunit of acetolactate synthase-domain-containing protein [Endogone sp. FLAS-F59071]